ncbi:MAG: lysoplasmalogenase [Propionibacteriaceae bacterium]|jgi:uncharacterized membrane protein YhhN|nr:lysoplasmalogenase [Propionibacteriaceae bacterium]
MYAIARIGPSTCEGVAVDLRLILLIVLGVVSVIYLVSIGFKETLFQYILRGCLMPLVVGIYCASTATILVLVICALVFAWIGDILLIDLEPMLRFQLGIASFLICHVCYIIAMWEFAVPMSLLGLAVSLVVGTTYSLIVYRAIRPTGDMKLPIAIYEAILILMAVFACQVLLAQRSFGGIAIFAGAILFIVSDTLLSLRTFRGTRVYFLVMLTYIVAQVLIIWGFSIV